MIFALRMGVRNFCGGITLHVTIAATVLATAVNVDAVTHTGRKSSLVGEWAVPFDDARSCDRERFFFGGMRQKIEGGLLPLIFAELLKSRCVLAIKAVEERTCEGTVYGDIPGHALLVVVKIVIKQRFTQW